MMKKILCLLIICLCSLSLFACKSKESVAPLGVWWWNDTLKDEYLEFARENKVSEIYYCSDDFNENTSNFISRANNYGIKVYWLVGEYSWLSDSSNLYKKINEYQEYQNRYTRFEGIHLDIEPHQDPTFKTNRGQLILNLIQLANNLKNDFKDILFDYDLPFWLNDIITYNNEDKEAYKHMIDVASRVFLMSYRDTSEAIYDVSVDEIEYAKSVNKVLFLGVETKSNEGDNVSFQEEGAQYMYEEILKVRKMVPSTFGISIHHIKTWHDLKE